MRPDFKEVFKVFIECIIINHKLNRSILTPIFEGGHHIIIKSEAVNVLTLLLFIIPVI
jgi:hypothetical protein